jgi:hypothetical protein
VRQHHKHGGKADTSSRFLRDPRLVVQARKELTLHSDPTVVDLCDLRLDSTDIDGALDSCRDEELARCILDGIWHRRSHHVWDAVLDRVDPDFECSTKLLR